MGKTMLCEKRVLSRELKGIRCEVSWKILLDVFEAMIQHQRVELEVQVPSDGFPT